MIASSKRLELLFWSMLPGLLTLLLLVICLVPKRISGMGSFMPLLPLTAIFYWGHMRAREMPYGFVFFTGFLVDTTGTPVGLSPVLYMGFLLLLHAQRKYIHKEGFVIKWAYFATLLAAVDVGYGFAMGFFANGWQGILPAFFQWLLTVALYPLMHKAFDVLLAAGTTRRWQILHGR